MFGRRFVPFEMQRGIETSLEQSHVMQGRLINMSKTRYRSPFFVVLAVCISVGTPRSHANALCRPVNLTTRNSLVSLPAGLWKAEYGIELNHTIVPALDKIVSANVFARIFGLAFDEAQVGYFVPVRVNETLTVDFDDDVDRFKVHHYASRVSEAEFDAIFSRIQAESISYGSEPHTLT